MDTFKKYDVAFSFSGKDRFYVEKVASELLSNDISVFYDKFEEADLWGKDLYSHLNDIYQNKAMYVVVFTSVNYLKNNWCNHELKSAQSTAFEKSADYILPAKFDDTVIAGILPTVGYTDLRIKTPNEFACLIRKKLELNRESIYSNMQAEKKNDIRELCHSRDFSRTHFIIKKLSRYSCFSKGELDSLMDAVINNRNISYIALDDDVFGFYSNIIINNREQISNERLERWNMLIDKERSLLT